MARKKNKGSNKDILVEDSVILNEETKKPKIVVKRVCNIKGKRYVVGDIFKPLKSDRELLIRLNEKGFIEPLTKEDLISLF